MEARIARLESDVAHVRTDVADIKVDVRSLRDKMDTMAERFDKKFDALRAEVAGVKDSIATANLRAFGLYIALAAAMFGTMARGFGWI
jgi:outer membrane murein-binding lipoprotein Lpp